MRGWTRRSCTAVFSQALADLKRRIEGQLGGQAGGRGYLIQAIVSVLDALTNDRDWTSITLEPSIASDKVTNSGVDFTSFRCEGGHSLTTTPHRKCPWSSEQLVTACVWPRRSLSLVLTSPRTPPAVDSVHVPVGYPSRQSSSSSSSSSNRGSSVKRMVRVRP